MNTLPQPADSSPRVASRTSPSARPSPPPALTPTCHGLLREAAALGLTLNDVIEALQSTAEKHSEQSN